MVQKVADLHVERREALAEIAVREMGKPMEQALGEVDFCGDIYGYYAERAEDFLKDEPIDLLAGEGTAVIRRTAMGPLIGIMPWNFPYYQVARFAGPNLIVGNTILLKPAPQCPESAEAIQAIYDEAGFPDGAYQTILATNDQIAEAIADPRVRGVSVTGSERAGAAVAEIAGRNLKKVVLEMGGSDPFILLATEDLDEAVEAAVERAPRQHRPVVQRRQAVHRRRRPLRRLPREVHGEDEGGRARRSDVRGRGDGAALVRAPRRSGCRTSSTGRSTQGAEVALDGRAEGATSSRRPC